MRRHYEVTAILKPEGGVDSVKQFAERVQGITEKMNGIVVSAHSWGEKKLAYEIKKNIKGHYVFFNLAADGVLISELERNFNNWEHVLKHMSIRNDETLNMEEFVGSAKGIATLFDKGERRREEKVETEAEVAPVVAEEKIGDNRDYNEKLQKSLSKANDEEEENVEL